MTLINWSGAVKNGRCYSILGNGNVYTQGLEILAWIMKWDELLSKTVKEKYLGVTMNANMNVSEQCRIAASKERGSSAVECRTRNQMSPGSDPPLLPFRRLGIIVFYHAINWSFLPVTSQATTSPT